METIHEIKFTIREDQLDSKGELRLFSLLRLAMDTTNEHSKLLGLGWHDLREKSLTWIVTRHKVQITRLPRLGEEVTVKTWPMPTTRVIYPRCVVAYDKEGKELFTCLTLWGLLDTTARCLVRPEKGGVQVNGVAFGTEPSLPNSILPRQLANSTPHQVVQEDLDLNGHVNNARYIDWVQTLLPGAFPEDRAVKGFTICYLSETLLGQNLELRWELFEDGCLQVDAHRQRTDVPEQTDRVLAVQVFF